MSDEITREEKYLNSLLFDNFPESKFYLDLDSKESFIVGKPEVPVEGYFFITPDKSGVLEEQEIDEKNKYAKIITKGMRLKSETIDGKREISLKYETPPRDVFTLGEICQIELDGIVGKKIIKRARDDSLRKIDKGMGHLLAEACIKSELGSRIPVFYSRIGCQELKTTLIPIDSVKLKNLMPVDGSLKRKLAGELEKLCTDGEISEKLKKELSPLFSEKPKIPKGCVYLPKPMILNNYDILFDLKTNDALRKHSPKNGNLITFQHNTQDQKKDTLSQDISNAVSSSKSIATIMVSCRYSDSGISDGGHTICIAVNTNKFDNSGELLKDPQGNPIRLTPKDCAIIDSSRAIIDYDMYHTQRDYGIKEIYSQLNQLIDVSSIKTYSLYPESIQVGPKCSDYARRAYQELSSGRYTDIADLKNRSFEFANSIHESVKKDYERVFKGKNNIPGHIKNELNDKAPKENDYIRQTMQYSPLNSNVAQQLAAKNITEVRKKQLKPKVCNLI